MKKNLIVYREAKKFGVRLWQLAQKIGIADTTLSKKMRHELTQKEQTYLLGLIHDIAKENTKEDEGKLGVNLNEEKL